MSGPTGRPLLILFLARNRAAGGNTWAETNRGLAQGGPCGGSRSRGRASGFGWRGRCSGVGGTFPAPAFPLGETGKGDQIPCCRRQFDVAPIVCTPLLSCMLFDQSSLPIS